MLKQIVFSGRIHALEEATMKLCHAYRNKTKKPLLVDLETDT